MAQVVLIINNKNQRDLYSVNLKTHLPVDVIQRSSSNETIELLQVLPEVNLVICQNKIGNDNTALKIYEFLKANLLKIPMIVLGENSALKSKVVELDKEIEWKYLVENAAGALGINSFEVDNRPRPDFMPMPISYFYELELAPCDIYLRISKGLNKFQYIKRIRRDDPISRGEIENYDSKGLASLHVSSADQLTFSENMSNNLLSRLREEGLSPEERIATTSNAYEFVKREISTIGLSPASIALADESIKGMQEYIEGNVVLDDFLKTLMKSKATFSYKHIQLIAFVAHAIINLREWGTKEQRNRVCFVAYFHDICLLDDRLIEIHNIDELDQSELTSKEKQQVLNHAYNGSKLVKDMQRIPIGADTIILEHHGKLDGFGFTEEYSNNLSTMSIVFIIAEEFVKQVLKNHGKYNKQKILTNMYKKFPVLYRKVLKNLEDVLTSGG
jgi:hypothetical protein